ncbi:hypothetical protein QVM80_29420, partial [Enterobacter hormaechei]|uniref:hypothetical protein n=1 Tax=Enterobacter hormaechei TaxID=158836 RepID=UPI0035240EFA
LLNSHYSGHEEWLYHRHHRLERVRVAGFLASNHYSLLKKAALAGTGMAARATGMYTGDKLRQMLGVGYEFDATMSATQAVTR